MTALPRFDEASSNQPRNFDADSLKVTLADLEAVLDEGHDTLMHAQEWYFESDEIPSDLSLINIAPMLRQCNAYIETARTASFIALIAISVCRKKLDRVLAASVAPPTLPSGLSNVEWSNSDFVGLTEALLMTVKDLPVSEPTH